MLESLPRDSGGSSPVPLHPLYLPIVSGMLSGGVLLGVVVFGFLGNFLRLPWWPQGPWQMVVIGAAVGGLLGCVFGWRNWRRWQGRKQLAAERSLVYAKKLTDSFCDRLQIFLHRNGRVSLVNAMHGPAGSDCLTLAGDMIHVPPSGGEGQHRVIRHLFCFEAEDLALPQFTLKPEGMLVRVMSNLVGVEDIDFEDQAEFSRAYHLSGSSPEAVRQLFQPPVLDLFREQRRWEVRGEGKLVTLVDCRRMGSVSQFESRYEEAAEVFARLRRAAGQMSRLEPPRRSTATQSFGGPLGSLVANGRLTHEQVREFFQQPPPREVSLRFTGRRLGGSTFGYILGAFLIVFGLCFGLIGLLLLQAPDPSVVPLVIGGLVMTAGVIVVGLSHSYRKQALAIFRQGQYTTGSIESVERTSLAVNDQVRYRARVRYDAWGSPQVTTLHLYGWAAEQAILAVDDQREIGLLVDPQDANRILLDLELIVDPPVRI